MTNFSQPPSGVGSAPAWVNQEMWGGRGDVVGQVHVWLLSLGRLKETCQPLMFQKKPRQPGACGTESGARSVSQCTKYKATSFSPACNLK